MFTLEQVVPWGRSLDEYRRMFDVSADDLRLRILGCADGPASFNAEATAAGLSVTSCDPLYRFSPADIARRITDTTEVIIEQTKRNQEEFVWTVIRSGDVADRGRVLARLDMSRLSVTRDYVVLLTWSSRAGLPEPEEYAAPDGPTSLSPLERRELSQRTAQPVVVASASPPFHTTISYPPIVRHEWRKIAASPDCFFD